MASRMVRPAWRIATTVSHSKFIAPHIIQRYRISATQNIKLSTSNFQSSEKDDIKARNDEQERPNHPRSAASARGTPQRNEDDRPWHRLKPNEEDDDIPSHLLKGMETKGRLLTTPTRLLKLILPLPFHADQKYLNDDKDTDSKEKSVTPLAFLIHPQQPLSYLERLIQAEIPPLLVKGNEKLPDVNFWAEADQEATPEKTNTKETNVASYSGLGHEGPSKDEANWVRWSGSTEVGDFIRDAARGIEFAVDIEGREQRLRVAVPSFKDRTHYMRVQLRAMSRRVDHMSRIKSECDLIAHRGAHRLAKGGFAALASWWGVVFYGTFFTEMGWDMIEPVTYLAGLTTIMGGYLWFLFISRDLSYKAAMNITVSRRQGVLYQERGFDQSKWENLAQEVNGLRKDIRIIASEYGAEWDEMKDLGGEEVKEALEREENGEEEDEDTKAKKKKKKAQKQKDDGDDDDKKRSNGDGESKKNKS